MCKCGCNLNNKTFKLRAPNGWYIIELIPGCDYCSTAPSVQIGHFRCKNKNEKLQSTTEERMSGLLDCLDSVSSIPDLPQISNGGHPVSIIKCGLDPEESIRAAVNCFACVEVEDGRIGDVLAETLGDDLWNDFLSESPSVINEVAGENDNDRH